MPGPGVLTDDKQSLFMIRMPRGERIGAVLARPGGTYEFISGLYILDKAGGPIWSYFQDPKTGKPYVDPRTGQPAIHAADISDDGGTGIPVMDSVMLQEAFTSGPYPGIHFSEAPFNELGK